MCIVIRGGGQAKDGKSEDEERGCRTMTQSHVSRKSQQSEGYKEGEGEEERGKMKVE